jgi:hypothetical protein
MRALVTPFGGRHGTLTVSDDDVAVRYGALFSADIPRAAIRSVGRASTSRGWAIGAHGWKGRWVVNGSRRELVELVLEPPVRGRTMGVGVTVRSLVVSVEDPAGLIAAVGSDPAGR